MAFFCPMFPKHKFNDDYESYDALEQQQQLFAAKSTNSLNAPQNWLSAKLVGSFPPYTTTRISSDFEATVDDEVTVHKEDIVIALYKEEDWLYVVRQDRKQGFVPAIYCDLFISQPEDKPQQNDKARKSKEKVAMRRERSRSRPDVATSFAGQFEKKRSGSLRKNIASTLLRHRSKSQDLRPPPLPSVDENQPTNSAPTASTNVAKFLQTLHTKPYEDDVDDDLHLTLPKSRERSKSIIGLGTIELDQHHRTNGIQMTGAEHNEPSNCDNDYCGQAFRREPCGRFVVAFRFVARFADDISVAPGQLVTALNRDDPDWTFVMTDGQQREGFVPACYILPIGGDDDSLLSSGCSSASPSFGEDGRGSELVVMRDFRAEARDDLSVFKGDWVYSKQRVGCAPGGWLWVYCPRSRRSGFVPAAFVKTPMATVL